ncbi:MAG: hypothetical protein IKJ06_00420 [Clostridia bacterium]|nr:hypothetical protein [Clostridia bacterium]
MTYDILNPETWNVITDDTPLVYKDNIILAKNGEPIKAIDFVNFLKLMQRTTKENGLSKAAIEKLLQNMIDSK